MKGVIIMTKQKFGLTGTALKTIALVLMVMDHIHYFFEFTGVVPEWFSMQALLSAHLGHRYCDGHGGIFHDLCGSLPPG